MSDSAWGRIVDRISDEQVLALEQAAIRIPSTTFEEGPLADHLANYMSEVGLDVEMMEVTHPGKPGKRTRQPIGRLRGSGGGPSLMLNGHMDPGVEMSGWSVDPYGARFEDGWIWGMGAHDDKGGVVAAICGVEAIVKAGLRLRGDVLVCPVVAHKLGGAGTRALLKGGVRRACHRLRDVPPLPLRRSAEPPVDRRHYRRRPASGFSGCLVLEVARKTRHLPLGTFDRELGKLEGTPKL